MEITSAQATLEAVLGYIREELKARSGRFLDRAERTLAQEWTRLADLNERATMMQATRWLASNKPAIHAALYQRLASALGTRPAPSAPDMGSLRVLDGPELAITLARDRMVGKVMNEGRPELAALEARFEILEQSGAFANPKALWPGALADNFVTVLKALGVPEPAQHMLMDVYGDEGIQLLLEFYRGINALLIRHGIAPSLQSATTSAASNADVAASPRPVDRSVFTLARSIRLVLDRLQRTMAGVNLKSWKHGQLRDLIERQFAESGTTHTRAPISRAQAQSIDHVESLLLDWLRDDRISERVREQIRRLMLPLLVARLSSADEFAAPDNPIRVFLRQLAVLGYRDQEFPLSAFESVQLVVERIVAEQGGEPASFRSAADALNTLSRQEVRRRLAVHSKERVSKPILEGARDTFATFAREAHRQVVAELTEHAAGLWLPAEIKLFVLRLLGPWMMVRYQRYGPDSAPWRQAREFAASFFDGLRPAVNRADAIRKRSLRERILREARIRTERSKAPPEKAAELLAALARHLESLDAAAEAGATGAESSRPAQADNFLDALQPIAGV